YWVACYNRAGGCSANNGKRKVPWWNNHTRSKRLIEISIVFTRTVIDFTALSKTDHLTAIVFHEVNAFSCVCIRLSPGLVRFIGHPIGNFVLAAACDSSCFEQYFSSLFRSPFFPFFKSFFCRI